MREAETPRIPRDRGLPEFPVPLVIVLIAYVVTNRRK